MSFPTAVNDQITDEVTQNNITNVAQAPAMALGGVYQSMAQAAGLAAENQVTAQQQTQIVSSAATTLSVTKLLSGKA